MVTRQARNHTLRMLRVVGCKEFRLIERVLVAARRPLAAMALRLLRRANRMAGGVMPWWGLLRRACRHVTGEGDFR